MRLIENSGLRNYSKKLLLIVLLLIVGAAPATAQYLSRTVSGGDLARAVTDALSGTRIHLHNLGQQKGASYHAANAASVKWPLSFGPGRRSSFNIPELNRDIIGRRYAYYIDHVRSDSLSVSAETETLTLTIKLASSGPALVGRCLTLSRAPRPCAALGDAVLPAIDWLDAHIDVVMKPIVFERSLAFSVENVSVGGRFDVGKSCSIPLIGGRLCVLVEQQSVRVRDQVAREIKAALDQDSLKRETATAVRRYLDETAAIPALGVRKVSMSAGAVAITLAFGR